MTPEALQAWARYVLEQPLLCTLFVILLFRIQKMHKENIQQREKHHQDMLVGFGKIEHALNSVTAMLMRIDRRDTREDRPRW